MKKVTTLNLIQFLIFVIVISPSYSLLGQPIHISSQEALNEYFSGKSVVENKLFSIRSNSSTESPITDFSPLSGITFIDCRLVINDPGFENLDGMSSIEFNNSILELQGNSLIDLSGLWGSSFSDGSGLIITRDYALTSTITLPFLEFTDSRINLSNNDKLEDIDGLSYIEFIADENSITIDDNPNLTSLHGLNGIDTIQSIGIYDNLRLKKLNGLSDMVVKRWVTISGCDSIKNLDGVRNIKAQGLSIYRNKNIESLTGIQNCVFEDISFKENESLTDLFGIGNIFLTGDSKIDIIRNNNLKNLMGFENLIIDLPREPFSSNINIVDNSNLESLEGMKNLKFRNVNLKIGFNEKLSSLKGFEGNIIKGEISITECPQLLNLDGLCTMDNDTINKIIIENNPNLISLQGIENKYINSLIIKNDSSLQNLKGMKNVQLGGLGIYDNYSLTSLSGIYDALKQVSIENYLDGSSISISNNNNLINLAGLDSTNNKKENPLILYALSISNNDNLSDIRGINDTIYTAILTLRDNKSLNSLAASNKIITNNLNLISNDILPNLNGIENIFFQNYGDGIGIVQPKLFISNNYNLSSLSGLPIIYSQAVVPSFSDVTIKYNENLTDISDLRGVITRRLEITNNSSLSTCCPVTEMIADNRFLSPTIKNNLEGCNNVQEIQDTCPPVSDNIPVANDQAFYVKENSPSGTLIGKINAQSPNTDDILSFKMFSSNVSDIFELNTLEGSLHIKDSSAFVIEKNPEFTFGIVVSNIHGYKTIKIRVLLIINNDDDDDNSGGNGNLLPEVESSIFEVDEHEPVGTFIDSIIAVSPIKNDTLIYKIISGDDNNVFKVDSLNGALFVNDSALLDYETKSSYYLTVEVSNSNGSDEALITILVLNIDENTVGTTNLRIYESINIYPNPLKIGEKLNIKLNKFSETHIIISLFDNFGRLQFKKIINNQNSRQNITLNTVGIAKGFYIIQIKNGSKTHIQKLIIH